MTTDVFGNETQAGDADKLAALIGEGKKYANETEALKALVFSQDHITNLETENAGLRTDLDKRLGAEEILSKLNESKATPGTTDTNNGDSSTMSETKSGMTDDDVRSVVSQMRQEDAVKANRREANEYVIKTFGDKAKEIVNAKANELGMSVESLQKIAENSPAAFKNLITGQAQQQGNTEVTPTQTSQGLDSNQNNGVAPHGTHAYFENIRKTDPKTYWLPATQNELHRIAGADPDKFFGR